MTRARTLALKSINNLFAHTGDLRAGTHDFIPEASPLRAHARARSMTANPRAHWLHATTSPPPSLRCLAVVVVGSSPHCARAAINSNYGKHVLPSARLRCPREARARMARTAARVIRPRLVCTRPATRQAGARIKINVNTISPN